MYFIIILNNYFNNMLIVFKVVFNCIIILDTDPFDIDFKVMISVIRLRTNTNEIKLTRYCQQTF